MKAQALDSQEAQPGMQKLWAYRDARVRSYAASTGYTTQQKIQAERFSMVMDMVYYYKEVYVTFRKKFITIKVDSAKIKNRKLLREMEADWVEQGITKVVTAQGVVYRIPKQ